MRGRDAGQLRVSVHEARDSEGAWLKSLAGKAFGLTPCRVATTVRAFEFNREN